MKKILFLAILLICWGCTNSSLDITVEEGDFYISQCRDQISPKSGGVLEDTPFVALKYSDEGLVIMHCNVEMNCYVKQQKPEVKYRLDGDVLRYNVYIAPQAKCNCFIEKMQSRIRQELKIGKEYTLVVNGEETGKFTWSKDLYEVIELQDRYFSGVFPNECDTAIEAGDFYMTNCGDRLSSKAGNGLDDIPFVTLKYSNEGLVITHCNVSMNCYVKVQKPDVSYRVDGNIINYKVTVPPNANCVCFIDKVQGKIREGLIFGKEYTLVVNGQEIGQFTWSEDLFKVIELQYDSL